MSKADDSARTRIVDAAARLAVLKPQYDVAREAFLTRIRTEAEAKARAAKSSADVERQTAKGAYEESIRSAETAYASGLRDSKASEARLRSIHRDTSSAIHGRIRRAEEALRAAAVGRAALQCWRDLELHRSASTPEYEVSIGQLPASEIPADLPFVVSVASPGHLFVQAAGQDEATSLLQSVVLRLTLGSAPGSLRLTLIDPVGAGARLAPFLTLPSALRGDKVLVAPEEIETQLRALNRHLESVVQTRLGAGFETLDQYNAANPAVAVPSQIVAILALPASWTERHVELLMPLLRNGPRAGVHVLATFDRSVPVPRGVGLEAIAKAGLVVRIDAEGVGHVDTDELRDWPFTPDTMPEPERVRTWLTELGGAASAPRSLSFASIAAPVDWSGSTTRELAAPIGLDERGEIAQFRLSDEPGPDVLPAHALLGGMTRMGKTNLLHVLIDGLCARYSPEEVRLYLLDFREGVGFAPYRELPHARVVALEAEREFALSVLRELRAEVATRGRLFNKAGVGDKFTDFRLAGRALPRILVVIDEFQVLLGDDDAAAREASAILEDLAKRGGGFGIHLLLSSQSPSVAGAYLHRMYGQIGLRIALRCREAEAVAILGEGNAAAAELETAGQAIYNDQLGRPEDNHLLRIARLPPDEIEARVRAILERDGGAHRSPITFESAASAVLDEPTLAAALAAHRPEPGVAEAFLGEPIELKETPTTARFERAPRSNLLIAGPDESEAYGLLTAAVVSLAAQQPDARFEVIEFARPSSPIAGTFPALGERLGERLVLHAQREASNVLAGLGEMLADRLAGSTDEPPRYLVVTGIQRWRELRGSEPLRPNPNAIALLRLLDEGPEHGLHAIVWTDGYPSLERSLKRGAIDAFDLRAVLRVPDTDSVSLIDSPAAAKLADNRAIFRDEQRPYGEVERFKPYRLGEEGMARPQIAEEETIT